MSPEIVENEALARAASGHLSNVNFISHCVVLGIKPAELDGSDVLEIGSGQENLFVKESHNYCSDANIRAINPLLGTDKLRADNDINPLDHSGSVAALAQGQIPFRDNSFDFVVSVMGVPNALLFRELPDFYNDVWRVLKPGGEARLWPHSHTGEVDASLMVTNALSFEEVDQRILNTLHPYYQHLSKRVVVKKPTVGNSPEIIAALK